MESGPKSVAYSKQQKGKWLSEEHPSGEKKQEAGDSRGYCYKYYLPEPDTVHPIQKIKNTNNDKKQTVKPQIYLFGGHIEAYYFCQNTRQEKDKQTKEPLVGSSKKHRILQHVLFHYSFHRIKALKKIIESTDIGWMNVPAYQEILHLCLVLTAAEYSYRT
jgi:hypothetical protein